LRGDLEMRDELGGLLRGRGYGSEQPPLTFQ
jgi:hypothetical protein